MPTLHRDCGGALLWKSVVDDGGRPAMIPWCRGCDRPVEDGRFDGGLDEIELDGAELADHGRLLRMAEGWPRRWTMVQQ